MTVGPRLISEEDPTPRTDPVSPLTLGGVGRTPPTWTSTDGPVLNRTGPHGAPLLTGARRSHLL